MNAVAELAPRVGVAFACRGLELPRPTYYRRTRPARPPAPRPAPARALTFGERAAVAAVLCEPRFVDQPPAQIYAQLLDEGRYLCSSRTMHRVLAATEATRERRDVLRHPVYTRPELLATRPNELWSWDITKLLGPATWTYFYLYVILDVFSRFVVGWMVAPRESAELAKRLIAASIEREQVTEGQITLHADRGSSMTSKAVAFLLADLGVTKTHSRPHVSNDNPFSESQFKTLKYRPDFPARFGSLVDARSFCADFFRWYNHEHHHSALAWLTPADVHHGGVGPRLLARSRVLDAAFAVHPARFVRGRPTPARPPLEVWINPPARPKEDPPMTHPAAQ